jgi:muramoyltetrapeptide carboxypeptidase
MKLSSFHRIIFWKIFRRFSRIAAKLTHRPSREVVDFWLANFGARESSREVSIFQHWLLPLALAAQIIFLANFPAHAQSAATEAVQPKHNSDQRAWIKPAALKPGDTIAIVAPAGPVDMEKVSAYVAQMKADGFNVRVSPNIDRRHSFTAGTDEQRVNELNAAIRDPEVKAIFPSRGGYGLTRILDRIDYAALRQNPKIVTGYSDLTALHLAIARQARLVSFHSPMPMSNLWQTQDLKFAFANKSFARMIEAKHYPRGGIGFEIAQPSEAMAKKLAPGMARGRLLGGNLTLITSTLGTKFATEPEGAILFIEDIEEAPYRVDRMLSQLRLAGVLDKIAGLIIGDFTYKDGAEQSQMDAVFHDYFGKAKYPVLWKFPLGHIPNNASLPHGGLAELNADAASLRLIENPVEL